MDSNEMQFLLSQLIPGVPHVILLNPEAKHKDSFTFHLQTAFNSLRNLSVLLALTIRLMLKCIS